MTMNPSRSVAIVFKLAHFIASLSLLTGVAHAAAPSPAPTMNEGDDLFLLSTSVAPNVVMLLDNSASMMQIEWHPAYDQKVPSATCTDWDDTLTYDAVHHDIGAAVSGEPAVQQAHDTRMVQVRQNLPLLQKAPPRIFRIDAQAQNLDHDFLLKLAIGAAPQIDHAHAATPDLLADLKWAQNFTHQRVVQAGGRHLGRRRGQGRIQLAVGAFVGFQQILQLATVGLRQFGLLLQPMLALDLRQVQQGIKKRFEAVPVVR